MYQKRSSTFEVICIFYGIVAITNINTSIAGHTVVLLRSWQGLCAIRNILLAKFVGCLGIGHKL